MQRITTGLCISAFTTFGGFAIAKTGLLGKGYFIADIDTILFNKEPIVEPPHVNAFYTKITYHVPVGKVTPNEQYIGPYSQRAQYFIRPINLADSGITPTI